MAGSAKDRKIDHREVVFCGDIESHGEYVMFTHEADVMMIAAAGEVQSGKLTPAEARELLEPYKWALPDPDGAEGSGFESFPSPEEVQQAPQASQDFWYRAEELGVKGVGSFGWSGSTGPVFSVASEKALTDLRVAVAETYRIVVKDDIGDFHPSSSNVEWARKLIEEAKSTPEILPARVRDPFGAELVYGSIGRRLGLVFLEEEYAGEIIDLRRALHSATTWGELRDMVSSKRYREAVEMRAGCDVETPLPNLKSNLDPSSLQGYAEGVWPEFAPNAMGRWVDEGIIYEYGWYAPTKNGFYPVIHFENEKEVIPLLERQGHVCTRDDSLIQKAVWGSEQ